MSLQRCEGNNLESVLEEVRTRFGDTVTIVEANRLRKGGLGGFFARERFEVVVDVDIARAGRAAERCDAMPRSEQPQEIIQFVAEIPQHAASGVSRGGCSRTMIAAGPPVPDVLADIGGDRDNFAPA